MFRENVISLYICCGKGIYMKLVSKIVIGGLLVAMASCQRFPNPFFDSKNKVLAEVGDSKLFAYDVSTIFTPGLSAEDSLKLLESYVDQWVKKQLKIEEAERMFEESQEDIDRLVQEYRNSLLTHKVDQFYVDKYIDTLFTADQIRQYYEAHKSDFVLDKTLIKARIVRLPERHPQQKQVEELLRSPRAESLQDLTELCVKNDFELIEMDRWTDMATLLLQLPTDRTQSYDYLLDTSKIHEFEANSYLFYVRVVAVRKAGDYAPMESVAEVIRRVLFNQRKESIVREHEDSLYKQAYEKKEIIVNVNR